MKRRALDELAPPASPFFSSTASSERPTLPSSSAPRPSEFLLAKALFEFSRSGTTTRNYVNNNSSNNKRATTATKFIPSESPSLSGSKSGSQPIRPPGTPPPPSFLQSPPTAAATTATPSITRQIHKLAMDQLLSHLSRDQALPNKLIAAILYKVQQKKKTMAAMEFNTITVAQPSGEEEIREAMRRLTGNDDNTTAPSQRERDNTLGKVTISGAASGTINQSQQKQQQCLQGVSEDMSEDAKKRRLDALKKLEALKLKLEARLAARRKSLSEQQQQQQQETNQPLSTLPSLSAQTLVPLSNSMESYLWSHTSLPPQQQQ